MSPAKDEGINAGPKNTYSQQLGAGQRRFIECEVWPSGAGAELSGGMETEQFSDGRRGRLRGGL